MTEIKMTPEAQRIAIAQVCGWKEVRMAFDSKTRESWRVFEKEGQTGSIKTNTLPDYLSDLNAMHEAENTLTFSQCEYYEGRLGDVVKRDVTNGTFPNPPYSSWQATAAQRAEAFLRALNLHNP